MIQVRGTFVKIRYSLSTVDGDFVKGDPREGPAYLEFFTGYDQVLPGLESRLVGKETQDRLEIRLPPEEAFGLYDEGKVREKLFDTFPQGRELEEGRWAMARDETTRASYSYFVKRKLEDRVVLDFNHPLAGKGIIYDLEVVEERPATDEEKILLRPCEGSGEDPWSQE